MKKVVIAVDGGVAEVKACPKDVAVEIVNLIDIESVSYEDSNEDMYYRNAPDGSHSLMHCPRCNAQVEHVKAFGEWICQWC